MKKIIALTVASLSAVLLLTGCGETSAEDQTSNIGSTDVEYVRLPDGRAVLCVSNWQMSHGGLSCDWDNTK